MVDAVDRPKAEYLDLNKFMMYSSAPGVTNKAKLVWGIRNTDPRISVFVPKPEGTKTEIISASLGVYAGMMLLEGLAAMVDAPPDTKAKVECRGSIRDENGKPTGETRAQSEVWYGKDKEGFCWISVVEGEKSRIKFVWTLWDYHVFYHSNGEKYTGPEGSCLMLKVAVEGLKHAYHSTMTTFSKFGNNNTYTKPAAPKVDYNNVDIEF